jgi:acylphosphatase
MERLEATIHGRVQGVGFRANTQRRARSLEISGWVANQPDGAVRVVAEGEKADLDEFLTFLRQGPSAARVREVEKQWSEASGEFSGFNVRWL